MSTWKHKEDIFKYLCIDLKTFEYFLWNFNFYYKSCSNILLCPCNPVFLTYFFHEKLSYRWVSIFFFWNDCSIILNLTESTNLKRSAYSKRLLLIRLIRSAILEIFKQSLLIVIILTRTINMTLHFYFTNNW